ncbi:hypothetical protein PsAD2_01936 [Pseudovibrio axinellae]|uniref:DUF1499 domain-containing protein n=1 Tax=Pseudovibrio axinellae TaxID=989403 RepID=A0A161V4J6_9HYPH|nr:DUF1499 domain-containing protein [Pseudovibrio axinellae]KZL19657.1 hypothetical protein PsAD2_01936 [Pseudovibrio axinellae]SEQ35743.1 Uncharacterized conserved protein, DUF1499 family [Pseudovibrio axinellae]
MAVIAILLVALVIGVTAKMVWQNIKVPAYVGMQDGKFAPLPSSPNAVSSQTNETARKVEPLPTRATLEETRNAITHTLSQLGKNKIITLEGSYVHTVFTSAQMGYNDDVEFWIDQDEGVVHYRSQSRVGYGDMGANRARYENFKRIYSAN